MKIIPIILIMLITTLGVYRLVFDVELLITTSISLLVLWIIIIKIEKINLNDPPIKQSHSQHKTK